ncbi:MAG: condensation domain-containing protein, partial [Methylovulum sp.]|nr:condensation domain-containing protein [Methylovulum sp.]
MILHEHPDGHPEPEKVGDYLFPTSYAQQRLWFLERLLGASGLYNISWAIRLTGRLDVPALQQSFAALVARHETLRTSFAEQDGEPVQIIRSALPFQCTVKVLPVSQEREIQGLLDAEASKPFDLKAAPLIRALLLALAEGQHILLTTLHHSIADGWSMAVFRQELAHFYRAFSQGQAVGLPE